MKKKAVEYRYGQLKAIPDNVEETRTVSFVISDESKDRHNSIINAGGRDLRNYEKNPIVGYQHQLYGGFFTEPNPDNVLGTASVRKDGNTLIADIQFEPAEINPLAEKIFRKVQHGTLRATSVGFYPSKEHKGDPEKQEEKGVTYYDEAELLEISIVNIPSNPNAVKNAAKDEKIELIKYILTEALGDKFNETLTIKGVLDILDGKDSQSILKADGAKYPNRLEIINRLLKIKEL